MEDTRLNEMRIKLLGNIDDDSKDELFEILLRNAENIALNALYPFDLDEDTLPNRVKNDWVTRCAIELYSLLEDGAYKSYSENGLSWTKSNELVSQELMSELTPKAGVPR